MSPGSFVLKRIVGTQDCFSSSTFHMRDVRDNFEDPFLVGSKFINILSDRDVSPTNVLSLQKKGSRRGSVASLTFNDSIFLTTVSFLVCLGRRTWGLLTAFSVGSSGIRILLRLTAVGVKETIRPVPKLRCLMSTNFVGLELHSSLAHRYKAHLISLCRL